MANDLDNSPLNPVFDDGIHETCPDCEGDGILNITDCCGAKPSGNGDCDSLDFGICPECHEYCDYGVKCETCNGTGEVEINKQDLREQAEEEAADEATETLMEKLRNE
jgi:RecJ-like exonuclease